MEIKINMKKNKIRIEESKIAITEKSETEYVTFSFSKIVRNKEHNFEYFKKNNKEKHECYIKLIEKIIEIEKVPWVEFINRAKDIGMETMDVKNINIDLDMTDDNKVIIIRFNKQRYRIIGYKEEKVFRILAFDFNYKAYKH